MKIDLDSDKFLESQDNFYDIKSLIEE